MILTYVLYVFYGIAILSVPTLFGIGIYYVFKRQLKALSFIGGAILIGFFILLTLPRLFWGWAHEYHRATEYCMREPNLGNIYRFDETCPSGTELLMKRLIDVDEGYKCCVPVGWN
jgi:hypothetical protein